MRGCCGEACLPARIERRQRAPRLRQSAGSAGTAVWATCWAPSASPWAASSSLRYGVFCTVSVRNILHIVCVHTEAPIAVATARIYVHHAQHEHTFAVDLLADRLLPVVAHRKTEGETSTDVVGLLGRPALRLQLRRRLQARGSPRAASTACPRTSGGGSMRQTAMWTCGWRRSSMQAPVSWCARACAP